MPLNDCLDNYFISTGFYDFLPLALDLIDTMGFSQEEAAEAICKVFDKARVFPPTKNRHTWFKVVFKEKLFESRADLMAIKRFSR